MRKLNWLWLSLIVIILDQITKILVLHYVQYPIAVTPFFNIILAGNTGAAFSFLAGASGWQAWLFSGIAVIISIAIIYWLYKLPPPKTWLPIALALILGGALGNVLDRIIHGFVIDFLDFHIGIYHWPTFNLADSAVVIGAIMLIIDVLFIQ